MHSYQCIQHINYYTDVLWLGLAAFNASSTNIVYTYVFQTLSCIFTKVEYIYKSLLHPTSTLDDPDLQLATVCIH